MAEAGSALVTFEEGSATGHGPVADDALYRLATRALLAEESLREAVQESMKVARRLQRRPPGTRPAPQRDRLSARLRDARSCEVRAKERFAEVYRLIAATAARSRAGQAIKLQLAIQLHDIDLADSDGAAVPSPVPQLLQSLLADLAGDGR